MNLLSFSYDALIFLKCLFSFIVFFTCFTLHSLCSNIIKLQLILTEKLLYLNNLYGLSIVNVKISSYLTIKSNLKNLAMLRNAIFRTEKGV